MTTTMSYVVGPLMALCMKYIVGYESYDNNRVAVEGNTSCNI